MTLMTVPMKGATHSTRGPSGPTLAGWCRGRYAAAAPATWNRELATLRAAVRWWRRRERVDRTRALTHGQLKRPMSVQAEWPRPGCRARPRSASSDTELAVRRK